VNQTTNQTDKEDMPNQPPEDPGATPTQPDPKQPDPKLGEVQTGTVER
jgi:hypothetical protein